MNLLLREVALMINEKEYKYKTILILTPGFDLKPSNVKIKLLLNELFKEDFLVRIKKSARIILTDN